jgi:hypothetical protein
VFFNNLPMRASACFPCCRSYFLLLSCIFSPTFETSWPKP